MELSNRTLAVIGAVVIGVVLWAVKLIMSEVVKKNIDQLRRDQEDGRKEREYDQYVMSVGQQATADVCHELVYCVINGTHNGGLDEASTELEKYRVMNRENMNKKAAKYNISLQK